jgi:hypothetical protein
LWAVENEMKINPSKSKVKGGEEGALQPNVGQGLLILEVSISHTIMHHSR